MSTDNAIVRYDGTAGATQDSGVTIDDTNVVAGALRVEADIGTTALPSFRMTGNDTGINFPGGDGIVHVAGNVNAFGVKEAGGVHYFGHYDTLGNVFPAFQFEDSGRTKFRTRSIIIADPGDTPEYARYALAGDPVAYAAWPASSIGQQMCLDYVTCGAADDDNAANILLGNTYRTINPFRHGGGAQTFTTYQPSISSYQDGMVIHVYWTSASGANPSVNINGWGLRNLKRNSGSAPAADFWNVGAEASFTYVAASTEFRATSGSDTAAGRTDRNGFMNPNWARSVGWKMRMPEATTETSRPGLFVIETTRPGESILRERFVVSDIGSTVVLGTGSYEDAADQHGIAREDYYPGDLATSATDDNYSGDYFAGVKGPHNAFTTPGWAGLSVVASKHTKWAALGVRKSGAITQGFDIAYDHGNDRVRFERAYPDTASVNISTIAAAPSGLIRVTTSSAHGLVRRETARIASVTGTTEANGDWTVWPVTPTVFDLKGSQFLHAYTSGGTVVKCARTVAAALHPQTGEWYFGGDKGAESLRVTPSAAAVGGEVARFTSYDAGASPGPVWLLMRDSVSPAANDAIGCVRFSARDSAGNEQKYGEMSVTVTDVTNGSEDSLYSFETVIAGGLATRARLGAGFYHPSVTGSDKGNNTINFSAVFDDNVLLSDYVFDKWLGDEKSYTPAVQARYDALDPAMFDVGKFSDYFRQNRRLYGMPDLDDCIDGKVKEHSLGAMIQKLWQVVELQAIHIDQLSQKIDNKV